MRAVTCPGCQKTLMVKDAERVRCSPCLDIVSSRTDEAAGMTFYYNARRQLVDRKPLKRGPGRAGATAEYLDSVYNPPTMFGN